MVSARTILATLGVVQLLVRSVCVCVRVCAVIACFSVCRHRPASGAQRVVRGRERLCWSCDEGITRWRVPRLYGVALSERGNKIYKNKYIMLLRAGCVLELFLAVALLHDSRGAPRLANIMGQRVLQLETRCAALHSQKYSPHSNFALLCLVHALGH